VELTQPRPEYLRLFNAIVLAVRKETHADVVLQRAALEKQLEDVNERKQKLIVAFAYRKAIDEGICHEPFKKPKEVE
jgi:hypothetical protein